MIGKNNNMIKFRVRQMTINDINTVLGIWAKNNLHEGTQTIQSFMIQDPEGFIVAEQIFDDDDDQDEKPKNDETMTNNGESGQNCKKN